MDENLFVLACQSIPVLSKKLGMTTSLRVEIIPPGLDNSQRSELRSKRMSLLQDLFSKHSVSWWDIFDQSEIGRERNIIAEKYIPHGSSVIDIGLGRGYFAHAAAKRAKSVVGVDRMNGLGRLGWWHNFLESRMNLGFESKLVGARSSGSVLPFQEAKFGVATSVHGVRNFPSSDVLGMLREMWRVLKPGGLGLLVESSSEPKTRAHETYLSFYNMRTMIGWEYPLIGEKKLIEWFEETGFKNITIETQDFNLRYAPLEFNIIDVSHDKLLTRLREEHEKASRS